MALCGRTYSQLATLSQFAGWSATFNVTGLTAGRRYSFTVTARAGIETDTATVAINTPQPVASVVEPAILSLSARNVIRTGFFVAAQMSLGIDEDGSPFSPTEIVLSWEYRESGTVGWVNAGTSTVAATSASASFSQLQPLTDYFVRARVSTIKGRRVNTSWTTITVRTGKVTRAAITQWETALRQAQAAAAASQALLVSLLRIEALLANIEREAQNVIDRDALPTSKVSRLRRISDDGEEIQRIANTFETPSKHTQHLSLIHI